MAAAKTLVAADDAWLRTVAQRDPDMIRDVAAALVHSRPPTKGPGCGAIDCVNACDGDEVYKHCPEAKPGVSAC